MIAERLTQLRADIAAVAQGRDVKLLAVSKTFPVEAMAEAFAAGQRHFGENYVQEAREKFAQWQDRDRVEWHLVGPLQRNKINQALEIFDYFHAIDSLRLLEALDQRALAAGKRPKLLLQVRLGEEESKHGFHPDEVLPLLEELRSSPPQAVRLVGLMTIPPPIDDARPHFRRLHQLSEEIRQRDFAFFEDHQLSMGMSDDYPVAIQEGATWIRVGRALFGHRPFKEP